MAGGAMMPEDATTIANNFLGRTHRGLNAALNADSRPADASRAWRVLGAPGTAGMTDPVAGRFIEATALASPSHPSNTLASLSTAEGPSPQGTKLPPAHYGRIRCGRA
jgi:hypothetical protein